jgi:hypothetical protein
MRVNERRRGRRRESSRKGEGGREGGEERGGGTDKPESAPAARIAPLRGDTTRGDGNRLRPPEQLAWD